MGSMSGVLLLKVDWEEGRITVLEQPVIELAYPFRATTFKGKNHFTIITYIVTCQ